MNLTKLREGVPQSRTSLYRFAQFTTLSIVFLLLAGAAVKSTESGLAVPDWPLSFGQVMPPMEGGVFYEHGHRMVATAVGFLTVILAFWFWMRDPRSELRKLGWIALVMVIIQGLLGGLTVLMKLPTLVSAAHACLAQAFLLVVTFMALSLSKGWNESEPFGASRRLTYWATVTTALIFVQLILGALTRHLNAALVIPDFPLAFGGLIPPSFTPEIAAHYAHRVGAVVVSLAILVTVVMTMRAAKHRPDFTRPALLMILLLVAQLTLGAMIILTRRHTHPTTTHVVVGAVLLAASFVLTARSWKFVGTKNA
ncbi:MAG: heme A synthase [Candidatus Eisenbacteria bacterium]|uniref:Heme A synthase n=1 Tax=Eiseniibacteriota bacterium TaxID=2212470 RepID=A0A7Y2E8C6_UNCEI|nr:heme A synthase [Candidatus Eisenbacteria bacterium]